MIGMIIKAWNGMTCMQAGSCRSKICTAQILETDQQICKLQQTACNMFASFATAMSEVSQANDKVTRCCLLSL